MIRLRAAFHSGLRHPVTGPLLLVLLAFALALLLLHAAFELTFSAAIAFCGLAAIVAAVAASLAWSVASLWPTPRARTSRARPPSLPYLAVAPPAAARALPLRM